MQKLKDLHSKQATIETQLRTLYAELDKLEEEIEKIHSTPINIALPGVWESEERYYAYLTRSSTFKKDQLSQKGHDLEHLLSHARSEKYDLKLHEQKDRALLSRREYSVNWAAFYSALEPLDVSIAQKSS